MATLTKDDLDNINTLFTKNFATIWKDNLAPAIDDLAKKDDQIRVELKSDVKAIVREEINNAGIATKKDIHDARDHIDNKIAEYSGKSIARDHGLEKRIDLTDHKLMGKNIFSDRDLDDIKAVPVFDPTNA